MSDFSTMLKRLRKEKNMTQPELAQSLGISRSAVSMYEIGSREPDLETLEAIADFFNVDMDVLTGRTSYENYDGVFGRMKAILKYKHVTISDLADILDVDKNELFDFLYNTPDADLSYDEPRLQGIANALNISVDAFWGYNIMSDDTTENYISFLFRKIGKDLPLTKQESLAISKYLNSSDFENKALVPDGFLPLPHTVKRPRLGAISCGDPIMSEENFDGYDDVPEHTNCDFTLVCEGDSMIGARICDGDIVYIKQQPTVENGQIAAILIDGTEKLLKRVYITDDSIVLQAENPAYPPRTFFKEDMNRVSIIGRAVGFYSNIK